MLVSGKKFLVTGAGNGMGREVALELLKRGAKVLAVDINGEFLNETRLLAGSNATSMTTVELDITDSDSSLGIRRATPASAIAARFPQRKPSPASARVIEAFFR